MLSATILLSTLRVKLHIQTFKKQNKLNPSSAEPRYALPLQTV